MPQARAKKEEVLVRVVDNQGQPLLPMGGLFTVVADVEKATTKDGENKTGYIVRQQGSKTALPYLYRKSRFVLVPRT